MKTTKNASFVFATLASLASIPVATPKKVSISAYSKEVQMQLCHLDHVEMASPLVPTVLSKVLCSTTQDFGYEEDYDEEDYDEEDYDDEDYDDEDYDEEDYDEERFDPLYAPADNLLRYNFRDMNANLRHTLSSVYSSDSSYYDYPRTIQPRKIQPTTIGIGWDIAEHVSEFRSLSTMSSTDRFENIWMYAFNGIILFVSWTKYMALFEMIGVF
eukprot:CAMPEP_0172308076 /NCGR_PEP_ID=MMETSP1058-20130122/8792_1 /TAXON_ID=83371 /ORGANISM="Detonula confervacea, Strain CCMP 353" /LENGTH=213 /DNA_ID=CAMNT_0013020425 /DNA_START=116 /DNA_END=757 /DNA_ORIENTATION=-